MKILYHHRVASKDGQYVHIDGMLEALRAAGNEVVVVGPKFAEQQDFGGASGPVAWMKRWIPRPLYELAELGYSALDYFRLAKAIRAHHPDVVYERYNLFFLSGLWAARRCKLPWLVEVNAPLFDERSKYDGIALQRLARWSERAVWRGADHVFAVTQVLGQRIAREGVGAERISVTPNGVHPEVFAALPPREQAKRNLGYGGKTVLGFTGFVRAWHGLERVFEVMQAMHAPSQFLIVGDGPARADLEQRAEAAGLAARVRFTGLVARSDVVALINAFDIALQPDVVAYASPLKLFEYLAAGCAVVAPDRPNIREILTHEANALLFDPDDPHAFFACVERLLQDPALRQRLGDAARATIVARGLTWDANAARVVACAQSLLDARAGGTAGAAQRAGGGHG